MPVKNSEIVSYFKFLAVKHTKIKHDCPDKHFYQMELNDFAAGNHKLKGFNLILEVMPLKFNAINRDNSIKIREVAFIIIKSLPIVSSENIVLALDECEQIVDDILSRINSGRMDGQTEFYNMDTNSIDVHQVSDGKNFGVRCLVDLSSPHNFEINWQNWNQ